MNLRNLGRFLLLALILQCCQISLVLAVDGGANVALHDPDIQEEKPFLTTKKLVLGLFILAAAGLISWAVYKNFFEKPEEFVLVRAGQIQGLEGNVNVRFGVGDITNLQFNDPEHAAIVNAANELMLGGGGIDGAIHRAAGPGLRQECAAVPQVRHGVRCPTGEARITGGHNLAPVSIIHTVGPDIRPRGGVPSGGDARRLENCYQNVLHVAQQNGVTEVAVPSISTGVFAYPLPAAAAVAAAR